MKKDDCYLLGRITKTHALKGEVAIFLDVDNLASYQKLKSIYLDFKGELKPFKIESLRLNQKKSIVKLEGIDSIESAEEIVKTEVYLPLTELPKLRKNQFYYHDVIGYIIQNGGEEVGKLKTIYESTGQDLFSVEIEGKEVLIPITDEFIEEVDSENKIIKLNLPDGLLEVYLND